MKKTNVLDIKNEPAVITYIQMLQDNITRMCNYSGIIKALACTLYTVLISVLIANDMYSKYWWVTLFVVIVCMLIDAYYLGLENIYRDKYNELINKLNANQIDINSIYDMRPRTTNLKCELFCRTVSSLKSVSVYGIYTALILVSVIIRFI